ncbi:hypothetical protein CEXT_363981 [Caerostris extrusa]|uniref:Uncharacterized protein n=1 Tax=Caerostris extrusa TaxID=172846 RepID=A0AAV4WMR6_CAEEX|nr:hypothetical protein CEXT_363981 [Caerostris extrusa]
MESKETFKKRVTSSSIFPTYLNPINHIVHHPTQLTTTHVLLGTFCEAATWSVGTLVEAKGTFTGDGPGKLVQRKGKVKGCPKEGEERKEERGTVMLLLLPFSVWGRCRRKGGALDLGTPQWGRSASRLCGCRSHAYYFTTLSPSAAATAPAYK